MAKVSPFSFLFFFFFVISGTLNYLARVTWLAACDCNSCGYQELDRRLSRSDCRGCFLPAGLSERHMGSFGFYFLCCWISTFLYQFSCLFRPASCSRLFLLCYQEPRICFPSFPEDRTDFGSTIQGGLESRYQCVLRIEASSSAPGALHKREIHCSNFKVNKAEYPILVLQRKSNQEEMQACLK